MSQAYPTIDDWEMFSPAFEQFCDVVTQWRSDQPRQLEHGQVAPLLEKEGRKLLRSLLQGHLDDRAATETDGESTAGADGLVRSQHRPGRESHLDTLFGDAIVTRRAYRALGPGPGGSPGDSGECDLTGGVGPEARRDRYECGLSGQSSVLFALRLVSGAGVSDCPRRH